MIDFEKAKETIDGTYGEKAIDDGDVLHAVQLALKLCDVLPGWAELEGLSVVEQKALALALAAIGICLLYPHITSADLLHRLEEVSRKVTEAQRKKEEGTPTPG